MILFFDTETTGLPKDYKAPVTDTDNRPRLVQLAYSIYDDDWNFLASSMEIIKPNWFTISKEVSDIHRVTQERAEKEGKDIKNILFFFKAAMNHCKTIVAHNISFDMSILWCERYRLFGVDNLFKDKEVYCTMKAWTDICKIDWKYGYKRPKLQELHTHLFLEWFEDAHDALVDVNACAKCYFSMMKL